MKNMMRAGVVGDPIGHSLSPRLHRFWLDKYDLNGTYEAFHVTPKDLSKFLKNLSKENIKGVNLTIPHKETAMAFLDEIDDKAQRIGAVNTVIVKEDGRLFGTNTDGDGFYNHLRQSVQFEAKNKTAIIIGAGGAARAILVSLLDAGVKKIILVNRTKTRADDLKTALKDPRISTEDWSNRTHILNECDLLINTTSLGMKGQPELDLNLENISSNSVVYDIIYNPLQTKLLKEAAQKKCLVIGGLGMLLHQACGGFNAWFGKMPKVDEILQKHMLEGL
jgi:shikimate dehydrogenase